MQITIPESLSTCLHQVVARRQPVDQEEQEILFAFR